MADDFRQLETLFKIEKDKEQGYATDLNSAQSFYQLNIQKLKEVEGYKLDYLRQLQQRGNAGLQGGNYMHFQRFIVQLDEGIVAQCHAVDVAKQVVQQRRAIWLEQRSKT
ncbi:flagellar export protein FliJ [Psychrosphaera algicola]|uniref:Flagellar FliJ protein n=2 Tax=Psychrosphaera TaxID=907197 RepID=A0ABT5FA95_9GAMM|nr:flagellar export protein FliJ [Psychrosphaera sp. G1-22]MDC2888326.1 flagellar export protein FliJ [Psychrosphaera sp. G1-22]